MASESSTTPATSIRLVALLLGSVSVMNATTKAAIPMGMLM